MCLLHYSNCRNLYPISDIPFAVKVRLQAEICTYEGPWSCFRSIVRQEGFHGLFRGLSSPLVGAALETGVNYSVYEATMTRLNHLPDPLSIPISAATAGFFLSFIVSPAELIKCRMQLGAADTAHSYSGPIDCARPLIKSEGLRGLGRGLAGTMAREMPGNAVYFGSYKTLRQYLPGKRQDNADNNGILQTLLDASSAIMCGAAAGMIMWAVVLPIDVAKTRIQTAWPGSPGDVGLLQQLKLLYKTGGRKSLYAGLTPTLIRAAPANAAQWLVWELLVQNYWEADDDR